MTVTNLKSRLSAKARRTVVVPVQVEDPGPARRDALAEAERLLSLRSISGRPDDELAAAQAAVDQAREALAECYAQVEFTALIPVRLEEIQDAHTDAEGHLVRQTVTPVLAAACAVDAELQDEQWWTEQLTSGTWSWGEQDTLYKTLVELNYEARRPHLPKG